MKYISIVVILMFSLSSYSGVQCVDLFIKSTNVGSQSNTYAEAEILSTLDSLVELKFQIDSGNVQDTQLKQAQEKLSLELGKIIEINRKYLQIFNNMMKARINDLTEKENSRRREERQREKVVRETMHPMSQGRKLVFHEILPGTFPMLGAPKPVTITKSFELAQTQTTQLQWSMVQVLIAKYINKNLDQLSEEQINPSSFKTQDKTQFIIFEDKYVQMQPDHPVEQVSYDNVELWITGLNELSLMNSDFIQKELQRIIPGHRQGHIYDLPTEAQLAFVRQNRGKNNENYFDKSDDSELDQYAWYEINANGQTHSVATNLPRKIDRGDGILVDFYDLEGNVWEWNKDSWDGSSPLQGGIDPLGISGSYRVFGGGSWHSSVKGLRSGHRVNVSADESYFDVGFRLARTIP